MKSLKVERTKQTPEINFDAKKGILQISGRSIPENTFEFYDPLLTWINGYILEPNEKTIIKIQLEYFNTSSSKYILEILKKLKKLHIDNKNVQVEWYYEEDDEEMMETGEDYKDLIQIPFEIITLKE